jgi:CBS domain-containing protein
MRAKDIMSSPVVTVREDTSLKAVAGLLLEDDISAVAALNVAGQIVGIVSDTTSFPSRLSHLTNITF